MKEGILLKLANTDQVTSILQECQDSGPVSFVLVQPAQLKNVLPSLTSQTDLHIKESLPMR